MPSAYLAVVQSAGAAAASDRWSGLGRRLAEGGWRAAGQAGDITLWTTGEAETPIFPLSKGRGFVIGELFPMPSSSAGRLLPDLDKTDAAEAARRLARCVWGRYVALLTGVAGEAAAVFRDPSGLIGSVAWDLDDGLAIVASDVHVAPGWLAPRRLALNWDRIADYLVAPALGAMTALFDDVAVVPPGGLVRTDALTGPAQFVWSPAEFAANGDKDLADVAAGIARRTETCAGALVERFAPVAVELSGGLDSSVVAGAIAAAGQAHQVAAWLNYQDPRPEADESRYARAVTERIGAALTTPRDWARPIDLEALREIGGWSWPGIGGVDAGRDREELARLKALGARAIVSGQGGDGVFFQFPTPLVLTDAWLRDGPRALLSPLPAAVARRTRRSVWSVLADARAGLRRGYNPPRTASTLVPPHIAAAYGHKVHPWVRHALESGLSPAKVLHVQGVAVTHLYGGGSRRLQFADMLLPLFAQPVLELALGVAVPDLAGESYDRPFERRVFADHLPPEVLGRRTKGDMSTYYGRLVARSLETLRPYLIEGCLAGTGLLDRAALDQTLDPQTLMAGGGGRAMDVLNAAAVEAWVRHWQGRAPDSASAPRRL